MVRAMAAPCAVRPRLICEPPPGAGEGGQPRAGEPDVSQGLEGNRRGGCSSFPTSILSCLLVTRPKPPGAHRKAELQPKSGKLGLLSL